MAGEENNVNEEADSRACAMRNYLEVARILQEKLHDLETGVGEASELRKIVEIAADEFGIPEDDHLPTGNKRRRMSQSVTVVEEQSTCTCRHVCPEHEELMNPNLWGSLPHDVLQMVFSRLPLPDVSRLHCLSRDWEITMATVDSDYNPLHSDFFRVCGEAYPRLFAFVTPIGYARIAFEITAFDIKSNKWHTSHIVLGHGQQLELTSAWDGGLVCFISSLVTLTRQERKLRETFVKERIPPYFHVIVANPLTKSSEELPQFETDPVAVHMVQIKVNRQEKSYKVLVVGKWRDAEGSTTTQRAEVYDSQTGRWTGAEGLPDLFLGFQYYWGDLLGSGRRFGLCAFDCAEGRLIKLYGDNSPCDGPSVKSYALDNDSLFVLHLDNMNAGSANESAVYFIVEYQFQVQRKAWERVRAHSCSHFERPPKAIRYGFRLFACNGFLVMVATLYEDGSYKNELSWIYDLATRKWSDLPKPPRDCWYRESACELQWDIHPYGLELSN